MQADRHRVHHGVCADDAQDHWHGQNGLQQRRGGLFEGRPKERSGAEEGSGACKAAPDLQAEKKQPEKKQSGKEKNRLRLSAIYEVSDDTVDLLGDLKRQAAHAKGKFRDSQEYKNFLGAVNQSHLLAKEIQQKRDTAGFDLKKAEAAYAASIRKLFKTASDYTDYKLKDHTENRQQEPEKKKLNDKDREKLNLMKNLTENKLLTKEKEAPAAKDPQIGAIK